VNKQKFSALIWRSNHGYTRMHGQPIIKKSLIVADLWEVLFVINKALNNLLY